MEAKRALSWTEKIPPKPGKEFFFNRFFLKMMLTYCLVVFGGLGLASYLVTGQVTEILTEKESRIDYEVVQKVKNFSDDTYKATQNIFARLYMSLSYYNNNSIVDYINPRKLGQLDFGAKNTVISSYLQDTCNANDFISDIFIVDYSDKKVYFTSRVTGRDVSMEYDYFEPDFLREDDINNKVKILPNHIPYYINYSSINNYPVISFCIYLFDENFTRFDTPLGYIVINVRADYFKSAYRNSKNFNGTVYVVDDKGYTLFDSSGERDGTPFEFERYGASSLSDLQSNDTVIVNMQHSDQTGFHYIDIVDKRAIDEEVKPIRHNIHRVIAVCILFTLVISSLSATLFSRRIRGMAQNMKKVEGGDLDARVNVGSNDEIGYLEKSFNSMCDKLQRYIQNEYVFQLKTRTAELKSLQSQINPHFLFNTLESIRVTAQINRDTQTARMVHILGELFRWNIKTRSTVVDLQEEVRFVRSYVELQKLRYDNAFEFVVEILPEAMRQGVPKLILQPLVENAINHGLCGTQPEGKIILTAIAGENGDFTLTVTDNGQGMDAQKISQVIAGLEQEPESDDVYSIGLSNVHQRIRLLFGERYGLSIASQKASGTSISVTMPIMEKEEMERYVQSSDR